MVVNDGAFEEEMFCRHIIAPAIPAPLLIIGFYTAKFDSFAHPPEDRRPDFLMKDLRVDVETLVSDLLEVLWGRCFGFQGGSTVFVVAVLVMLQNLIDDCMLAPRRIVCLRNRG